MFPADVAIVTSLLTRELEGARRPVILYENGSRITMLLALIVYECPRRPGP
ncbi:hypothetical protein ACFWAY_16665 [Rhodococcus sp. NPDC059968]|uniref:hypothetical protein n=1 Tax=Rhodococcus sp. NPDC059968 TaxID=3347017 RepID=UPI0036715041